MDPSSDSPSKKILVLNKGTGGGWRSEIRGLYAGRSAYRWRTKGSSHMVGGQVGSQPSSTTGSPPVDRGLYVFDIRDIGQLVTLRSVLNWITNRAPEGVWDSKPYPPQRRLVALCAIVEDYMDVTSASQSFTPANLNLFIHKSTHNVPLFEWVDELNK